MKKSVPLVAAYVSSFFASVASAQDLSAWSSQPPDWKGASIANGAAILTAEKWSTLCAQEKFADAEISATVTIAEAAKQFRFFGGGWSAWPDATFGDAGFESALLLRAGEAGGFRVQLSHKYQVVALVKWPEGGYVRVAPCEVKLNAPQQIRASAQGGEITVSVDGAEKIRWRDSFLPLGKGVAGIGVCSGARVIFERVAVKPLPAATDKPSASEQPYTPNFSVRRWLGDRQWVFDGDEPVLQLHYAKDPSCFAKLRPGYKPQLTFDSHWDLANQGAFPDAASTWTESVVSGGGRTLKAEWSARSVKDRFTTHSTMTVGFDAQRGTYTYDIESELDVEKGEPFHFRYGFDFEHHTPLDPFRWQYLVAVRRGGELYHRPVGPFDPGPQNDLEPYHGLRVWFGRHGEEMQVAPAVEYEIDTGWNRDAKDATKIVERKLNTAVCAAFYDTGVSFAPETAVPGTKIRVKYRYTGYPHDEAAKLFSQSKVYDMPTLDPKKHFIFADEWPKLTFSQYVPLSETWIYGRTPFMTGHNQRPTYDLVKDCVAGSGFAMRLGPASFGKAILKKSGPVAAGRYVVTALVKSENSHGPGGRIELEALQAKTNNKLAEARHFAGNGTFDWKKTGFIFEVPEDTGALAVAFGNAGTGAMLVTDVEFRRLNENEAAPSGIAKPNGEPPTFAKAPAGAIADFRMEEGSGSVVLNGAVPNLLGHLDLANLEWIVDEGRHALRFADNTTGRADYRRDGALKNYLGHPSYTNKDTLPVALAGVHGGGAPAKGVTLAAWIKPAPEMGRGGQSGKGDVVGYGARRFILGLLGQKAPYRLTTRINATETFTSSETVDAERWVHIAMTAAPVDGQWRVRLFLNGRQVHEGTTTKVPNDAPVVPSLVLGAEIFYFHDAYYRGLIGRVVVLDHPVNVDEIAALIREK